MTFKKVAGPQTYEVVGTAVTVRKFGALWEALINGEVVVSGTSRNEVARKAVK